MRRLFLANPLERQVMNRYVLGPIAGAVRMAAFYGMLHGPAKGVTTPEPVAQPVDPIGAAPWALSEDEEAEAAIKAVWGDPPVPIGANVQAAIDAGYPYDDAQAGVDMENYERND